MSIFTITVVECVPGSKRKKAFHCGTVTRVLKTGAICPHREMCWVEGGVRRVCPWGWEVLPVVQAVVCWLGFLTT